MFNNQGIYSEDTPSGISDMPCEVLTHFLYRCMVMHAPLCYARLLFGARNANELLILAAVVFGVTYQSYVCGKLFVAFNCLVRIHIRYGSRKVGLTRMPAFPYIHCMFQLGVRDMFQHVTGPPDRGFVQFGST